MIDKTIVKKCPHCGCQALIEVRVEIDGGKRWFRFYPYFTSEEGTEYLAEDIKFLESPLYEHRVVCQNCFCGSYSRILTIAIDKWNKRVGE